jgi:hypothetical protein
LELQVSSFSNPPRKTEEKIESHERELERLRLEVERQRGSFSRDAAAVGSRVDELRMEFEDLRGEVKAVRDLAGGEVAKSVTGLETLRQDLAAMKLSLQRLLSLESDQASGPKESSPTPSPRLSAKAQTPKPETAPTTLETSESELTSGLEQPGKLQHRVEIHMKPSEPVDPSCPRKERFEIAREVHNKALDGIISYLTKTHGGNLHDKGIVTVTSKSVGPSYRVQDVLDLVPVSRFESMNEPGQWICWDFHQRRVRPTHYALRTVYLKSWVVEGSLDGRSWTEIDRRTHNRNFMLMLSLASFTASNQGDFRFIRLSQTGKNHWGEDVLRFAAVEFFGTLSE